MKNRRRKMTDEELLIWIYSETKCKVDPQNGCQNWLGGKSSRYGYGLVNYKGRALLIARVVWFITKGSWPKGIIVHACRNRLCININHLEEGTNQDIQYNRKGVDNSQAKLNEDQVREIAQMAMNGDFSQREIGEIFDISYSTVSSIHTGKTWGHLDLNHD